MSAFAEVSAAVERVTRVRRSWSRKLRADCPVCGRRSRLEVTDFDSGKVGIHCHAGCDADLVREALDLPWSALFEDVSYAAPQGRSAEQLVLGAINGERWTVTAHDFGADADLALGIECIERLLPARFKVRHLLRRRTGRKIDWTVFPFTASFIQRLTKLLGCRVGEHRAARIVRALIAHGVIEPFDAEKIARDHGTFSVPIYRLADSSLQQRLVASSAGRTGSVLGPAMTPLLSAEEDVSSRAWLHLSASRSPGCSSEAPERSPPTGGDGA